MLSFHPPQNATERMNTRGNETAFHSSFYLASPVIGNLPMMRAVTSFLNVAPKWLVVAFLRCKLTGKGLGVYCFTRPSCFRCLLFVSSKLAISPHNLTSESENKNRKKCQASEGDLVSIKKGVLARHLPT